MNPGAGASCNDEHELAARAVRGDRAALATVWEQNRGWVAAVLLAHRPRGHELEDLVQEVAVVLTQKISGLAEPAALRAWLRTVTLNVARGAARRATPRALPLFDHPDPRSERANSAPETREESKRVLDAMECLTPDLREVLVLRSVHGWSQREIAHFLEVPETTVETRLVRARRVLRERVDRTGGSSAVVPSTLRMHES